MNSPFNLSRKYNTIAAIIGGALLATILTSLLLIRPAWANLKQLGKDVPTEQQQRNVAESQLAGLEKAKSYFADDKEIVDQVNIAVPIDPQVPQILLVLEQLAKDNKVRLTSFQPQTSGSSTVQSGQAKTTTPTQPTTGGATGTVAGNPVEITANFEGSYGSLISFFYTLERSLRLIDVKSITVANGGATGSSTAMTGAITFTAYYKQVEGSQPAVGAK